MRNIFAFTLVELLLVLVIIALLAGGISLSLKGRQNHHALSLSSRDLAETLQYAAHESRLRGLPCRVVFCDEKCYRVERRLQDSEGEYVPVQGIAGRLHSLAGNVRITGFFDLDGKSLTPVPESVVFDHTPKAFSGQINLQGDSGRVIKIFVNGFTGQVGIDE